MTQDEIIRMAREAGFINLALEPKITRFAALVAAHEREKFCGQDKPVECANGCPDNQVCDYCKIVEPVLSAVLAEREACAKVCDEMYRRDGYAVAECEAADECAAAIRARGDK